MGFFHSLSGDVDDEDNRCISISHQIPKSLKYPYLHTCLFFYRCKQLEPFLNVPNAEGKEEAETTLHTFSINSKNHLRNNLWGKYYYLYYTETEAQRDKGTCQRSQGSWMMEVGLIWLHLISHCFPREKGEGGGDSGGERGGGGRVRVGFHAMF